MCIVKVCVEGQTTFGGKLAGHKKSGTSHQFLKVWFFIVQLSGRVSKMKIDLFSSPSMDESDIPAYLLVGHNVSQSNGAERSLLGTAVSALSMGVGDSVLDTIEKKTGLNVSLEKGEETKGYSLVISKEIYKNLYVGYGKGLTDSESVFTIHYQLPDGFSVETESTSTTNKVELFWSVER